MSRVQVNTGNTMGEIGCKGTGRLGKAAGRRSLGFKAQGFGVQKCRVQKCRAPKYGAQEYGLLGTQVLRLSESCSDVTRCGAGFSNAMPSGVFRFFPMSVFLLLTVLFLTITLSACSVRTSPSGEDGAVHKTYTGQAARTEEASSQVRLRLVYSADDLKWKSVVEDTAEAFMKANEDIELELYCMPDNKNRPYIESLKILAAQKEFFDIVEMRETSALAAAGLLAPVPEAVSVLVENPGTYEGVCYGVPLYATTLGIIYNKDIFKGQGLLAPDTFEDFLQICETVKEAGYDPLALGAADVRHMEFWGNYLFRNYMVTEDGNVQWTAKRTRQMLADYRNLAEQGYINPAYRNVSDSQTAQLLASGQAAMVYTGPWMLTRIEDLNPQIHLGFFFLPGKDGITYAVQERRAEWGISAATARDKNKMEAAGRFLKFYYSEGIYENVLETMNGDSVTVRPVRGMDTQDQAIIKAAYSANPVRTGGVTDYAEVPDGFFTYFAQRLSDTLWGEESTSCLADELTRKWEREAP